MAGWRVSEQTVIEDELRGTNSGHDAVHAVDQTPHELQALAAMSVIPSSESSR